MVGAEDVPALAYFSPERLLLTSECGFGQVPLDVTHEKLRILVATCRELRSFTGDLEQTFLSSSVPSTPSGWTRESDP